MKPPSDAVTATTNQVSISYGAGASWKSISIPIASATRPETVSAPCVTTCASITSSASPSTISAKPAQLVGRIEKPKSAVTSDDRAERAGQDDARVEDLEDDAADAREEEQREQVRVDERVRAGA